MRISGREGAKSGSGRGLYLVARAQPVGLLAAEFSGSVRNASRRVPSHRARAGNGPPGREVAMDHRLARTAELVLIAVAAARAPGQQAPQFAVPAFPLHHSSADIVRGDFDSDGLADIAVSMENVDSTAVFLGDGEHVLVVQPELATDAKAALVVSDFDADGHQDLAAAGDGISILLGAGDGTFTAASTLSPGLLNAVPATGDFDGDGNADLLAVQESAHVFLGHGDATFGADVVTPFTDQGLAVAVGDFDEDGRDDAAVVHYPSYVIGIHLGQSDGSLAPGVVVDLEFGLRGILVTDVQGDGHADVVALTLTSLVFVLPGQGDGTFGPAQFSGIASAMLDFATGDLNADGSSDLALTDASPYQGSTMLGTGDGSFVEFADWAGCGDPGQVVIGDVQGDGLQDVIIGDQSVSQVAVLRGDGTGALTSNGSLDAIGNPQRVLILDATGDGVPDVATTHWNPRGVQLFAGDGAGSFAEASNVNLPSNPSGLAAADFNGDGAPDLVACGATNGAASVLLDVHGSYPAAAPAIPIGPSSSGCSGVATGDFDGDGDPDFATSNTGSGDVSVVTNLGGGSFVAFGHEFLGPGLSGLAVGDFDEDGTLDLAVADPAQDQVDVLVGLAHGDFLPGASAFAGMHPIALQARDLDQDGHLDLVVLSSESLYTLAGDGRGQFDPAVPGPGNLDTTAFTCVDIDGDDTLDVVTADHESRVAILLGDGTGSLALQGVWATGQWPGSIDAGDLDGDGRTDLALSHADVWTLTTMLQQASGPWFSLGFALAGSAGDPVLGGHGPLVAASAGGLELTQAKPGAAALLGASLLANPTPFKGGTLVSVPLLLALPWSVSADGMASFVWTDWPAGLSGTSLFMQCLIEDDGALHGVALSNALEAAVP